MNVYIFSRKNSVVGKLVYPEHQLDPLPKNPRIIPFTCARDILCAMADLNLAPSSERSSLPAILIAAAVLVIGAASFFYFMPHENAKVSASNVQIFSPHTEFAAAQNKGGMNIVGQQGTSEDDLYVVVTLHIEDELQQPMSVDGVQATLTLKDDSTPAGSIVARSNLTRLQGIFPNLAPMLPHPIGYSDDVAHGKPLDGQVVVQFPGVSAQDWQSKKSVTLTLTLRNQPPMTINLQ